MEISVGAHPDTMNNARPNNKIKTSFIEALMSSTFQQYFQIKTEIFGLKTSKLYPYQFQTDILFCRLYLYVFYMRKLLNQYGYAYEGQHVIF